MNSVRPVLRSGDLAYYDSFFGIIPCKVISISGDDGAPGSAQTVTLKLTAARKPMKRGEVTDAWGLHVMPRAAFKLRRHGARITYYTVECDK